MLHRILEVTVPVFGIVLLSFAYGRWRPTDMLAANRLNLNVFIPALIFYALTERTGGTVDLGQAALGGAVILLGSGLVAWLICHWAGLRSRTLVPSSMFNNCGNMGLPLAVFAFGQSALPVAVVLLVVMTAVQFTLGLMIFSGRIDLMALLRNPMVIATVAGIVAMVCGWHAPAIILPGIKMLSQVAIPLMLVALGVRLSHGKLSEWRMGLIGGALTPVTGLMVAVPWVWLIHPPDNVMNNLMLFAVLPPAVMNFLLAEQYNQNPDAMAAIVAIGNAMALVTVPAMLLFLFS